ncbi:MAG: serine protease, partial [Desulfobacula sp.]|nr:serine protease [Desulfobacula sp.]
MRIKFKFSVMILYRICRKVFIIVILFTLIITLDGCSGCSQSGIKNKQKERNYSNNNSQRNGRSIENTNTIEPKERNSIPSNNKVLPLNELYNKYKSSVFIIYTSDGVNSYQGTGFFISKNGIAVSNYHVFKGTSQGLEVIETSDGNRFNIDKVLSKSDENDYIIFKVKLSDYIINRPIPIANKAP